MKKSWHWFTRQFNHYFSFDGRASLGEFWSWTIWYIILVPIIMNVIFITGGVLLRISSETLAMPLGICVLTWFIGTILPSLAVTTRRLHDIGKSGWWQLINFIPFVGPIVLLFFYCSPSDKGVNRYGSPAPQEP